jgi:hypothetical protein
VTGDPESGVRRDRLEPEVLLYGFMRSIGRFTRSGLSGENLTEPDQDDDLDRQVLAIEWTNAVFEALNWSVTLDDRIRHESKGKDWTVGIDGGSVIRALRYARNSVHHDWSAALDIGLAPDEFLAPHETVFGITWVEELAVGRPDRRGAAAYADTLAGRNVGETLLEAGKVCEKGIKALRAANAPPREVNTEATAMALYHCVYPEENFEQAAREIFDLVRHTIEFFPNAKRSLYLDIEGHRTSTDAFDKDMFELQKDFLLGYLMPFLTEARVPLAHARNPNPQRDDLPDELRIYASSDEVPNDVEIVRLDDPA